MRKLLYFFLIITLFSCTGQRQNTKELASEILADESIKEVDRMARELMKQGFYAGSGYQMVWARDLNTFIELSCEEYDVDVIRENLLMFFHFQLENGELLDGYVPKEAFTWDDPNPYYSQTAPGHVGFKNTVETDQETSLIQAIGKYISKTGDRSILNEPVAGITVYQRLSNSIEYLLNERYSEKFGLITGATTFDWGDVQVEGGAVVDVDENTHWSVDIYDNAMLLIALKHMERFSDFPNQKKRWKDLHDQIFTNSRQHLWDEQNQKFIPHLYIDQSPFSDDFDENAIHFHGGTAVAIEAGLLNQKEIAAVLEHMKRNVESAGAPSIGLTIYPPYPAEELGENVSAPYDYQNGGDWTWFGGRMIQQLILNGFTEDAWELARPMFDRVLKNNDFYEWYRMDGTPSGSSEFKGSAGVLAKSIELFREQFNPNPGSRSIESDISQNTN
jgi:hypothetical protein